MDDNQSFTAEGTILSVSDEDPGFDIFDLFGVMTHYRRPFHS